MLKIPKIISINSNDDLYIAIQNISYDELIMLLDFTKKHFEYKKALGEPVTSWYMKTNLEEIKKGRAENEKIESNSVDPFNQRMHGK